MPVVAWGAIIIVCVFFFALTYNLSTSISFPADSQWMSSPAIIHQPKLDRTSYDKKLAYIAQPLSVDRAKEAALATTSTSTSTLHTAVPATHGASTSMNAKGSPRATSTTATSIATSTLPLWPVNTVYPNYGALLPFDRIVAYYGNFYTGQLGVLGQYPPEVMLGKLKDEAAKWQAADPETPVIPAIDYIAVTAQGSPGDDGKYRLRMPADQIQRAVTLADEVGGLVFLDIQVGQSDVQTEVPLLEPFLKLPNVELALDPEFAMPPGKRPGRTIGSIDATDINFAAQYLAQVVKENDLPPKILVIHRFTEEMVTRVKDIAPLPEVQMVMDMDGFGTRAQKMKVYGEVVTDEPVQFTGLKLFYKNDVQAAGGMMTDAEILNLRPQPSYIQYQ